VGALLEIACDESGSDGENLTGGNTDVFAHAGVSLSMASAAAVVGEIRDRIRSPAEEYKANHLLREKHRAVLEWLLAPEGPIDGQARVHLMEKTYFVVDRTLGLLLDDAAEAALLFRAGRPVFGEDGWRAFLEAANQLLRVRHDGDPVDAFYGTVDTLRRTHRGTDAARILERLARTRPRAVAYRDGFLAGPPLIPLLNPLLPAIVRTAALWSGSGRSTSCTTGRTCSRRSASPGSRARPGGPGSASPGCGSSWPVTTRGCRWRISSPGSPARSPPTS
jgi:hypothetical protein